MSVRRSSDGSSRLTQSLSSLTSKSPGMEIIISSFLATLTYLPFRLVARVTIVVCALLFVADPYPGSRLVSLIATRCVLLINRARQVVSE